MLFVCKGNIFRSYAAEVIASHLGYEAESAGLIKADYNGRHEGLAEALRQNGFEPKEHTPRVITPDILQKHDLVLVMETWMLKHIEHAETISEYFTGRYEPVKDPQETMFEMNEWSSWWYRSQGFYDKRNIFDRERCYDDLVVQLERIISGKVNK